MPEKPVRRSFDAAFYETFYDKKTVASLAKEVSLLARFVLSYLEFLDISVSSVLDAGCGMGLWRRALGHIDQRIDYTGIDASPYLCETFGWAQSTIAAYRSRRKFDLVICQDVFQYLDADDVRASVDNAARLCRRALYVNVPTKEDFREGTVDVDRTDTRIYLRSAGWYRRVLARHFTNAGGGIFLPNRDRSRLLALERGA